MNLSDIIWLPLVIIGGLIIGLGAAKVWHGKSKIKKPRIRGEKRDYYTFGEIWMQRLRLKYSNEIKQHRKSILVFVFVALALIILAVIITKN